MNFKNAEREKGKKKKRQKDRRKKIKIKNEREVSFGNHYYEKKLYIGTKFVHRQEYINEAFHS